MNEEKMMQQHIHWFPGHMMRTLRSIDKNLVKVDAVIQLLDARIPRSSLNPDLQKSFKNKPRLYILNKSDLADDKITADWLQYFKDENTACVAINSKQRGATAPVKKHVETALQELLARRAEKGMVGAKTRLMITGIPNVGKSTFINNWVGSVKAKAADKPGVTRGEQWITTADYELLDMPGVLWKKFETIETAVNLALIGSIPDRILNTEEIAAGLLSQLVKNYEARIVERFKLVSPLPQDGWELLEMIGKRRGMLISGGEIDLERASIMILDEFRAGKFGRISLEKP